MLNKNEQEIMTAVCNRHILKATTPVISSVDQFFDSWQRKYFTPTFEKVCKKALSSSQIMILVLKYKNNFTVQEIALRFKTQPDFINNLIMAAVDRLSITVYMKELYIGSDKYEAMMIETRKKIREATEYEAKDPNELYLNDLALDSRSANIFAKVFCIPISEISAKRVIAEVPSLRKINNCGYKTRLRSIEPLKKHSFAVFLWEEEIQSEKKSSA